MSYSPDGSSRQISTLTWTPPGDRKPRLHADSARALQGGVTHRHRRQFNVEPHCVETRHQYDVDDVIGRVDVDNEDGAIAPDYEVDDDVLLGVYEPDYDVISSPSSVATSCNSDDGRRRPDNTRRYVDETPVCDSRVWAKRYKRQQKFSEAICTAGTTSNDVSRAVRRPRSTARQQVDTQLDAVKQRPVDKVWARKHKRNIKDSIDAAEPTESTMERCA